jgi:hypothetical protein
MPEDESPVWGFLRDRADESFGAAASSDQSAVRFRREAVVRLLDAAVGVLSATRHLVEVAEEVAKEQRDRLAIAPIVDRSQDDGRDTTERPKKRIDLTY